MWPDLDAVLGDPNLQQGIQMTKHEKRLLSDAGPHLDHLSIASDPLLASRVEALGDSDSDRKVAREHVAYINDTEREFNRTLAEYAAAYKEFSEQTMKDIESRGSGAYRNTVVDPGGGDYVYVSDHGITHKYSAAAWGARAKSCPGDAVPISPSMLAAMDSGAPMRPHQPCGVSGKNVRDEESGETAWVDVHGVKHVYSQKTWREKQGSCEVDIVKLAAAEYEAIPSGSPMRPTQECDQGTIDPRVWLRLQKLNARLVHLATELGDRLDKLHTEDAEMQSRILAHKTQLKAHASSLRQDRAARVGMGELQNAIGREQSTGLVVGSRWYHYLVWIVTAIVVVVLTSRALSTSDPGSATTLIALVALLVILYNVVRWLYDRLVR